MSLNICPYCGLDKNIPSPGSAHNCIFGEKIVLRSPLSEVTYIQHVYQLAGIIRLLNDYQDGKK